MPAIDSTGRVSRRTFLRRLAVTGALLGVGGAAYPTLIEPRRVGVSRVSVRVPDLPPAWEGLTIAHLTDLHRSRFVGVGYLENCIAIANALEPDLMVFTGDYLTHGRRGRGLVIDGDRAAAAGYVRDCAACLSRARARYGLFATLGNHDHWYDARAVGEAIESVGIPVLRNTPTHVAVNGESLPVVGLDDLWTGGVDLDRAFRGVDAPFALVLMHNPDTFADWPRPGSHLILSGHTHGGQVNLPFVGPLVVPSEYGARYAAGLFARGATQMYVNRGIGLVSPPVRFNCPPEIALLRLERA